MENSKLFGALRTLGNIRIGLFGLVLAVSLVGAIAVHAGSSLPWRYSWLRTLELFLRALTDRYFMVMALVVVTAAAIDNVREVPRHPDRRNILPLAIGVGCIIALLALSENYSVWDYLASPIVVAILFLRARDQNAGSALFGSLATIFALVVVSYIFTIFKSQLFVVAEARDHLVIELETRIFGMPLFEMIANWASNRPMAVSFSNWIYYLFFHHMALTALFLYARGNQDEQWRYVKSLSMCYVIGGASYFLFPAKGPIYVSPESFQYLADNAEFTVFVQDLLRRSTEMAVAGTLDYVETFAFVACMPSLHMAHETLMLYFVRRSKALAFLGALFWLGSALAVLVLGWHYALDIAGGIALAIAVLAFVYRKHSVSGRPERPTAN